MVDNLFFTNHLGMGRVIGMIGIMGDCRIAPGILWLYLNQNVQIAPM